MMCSKNLRLALALALASSTAGLCLAQDTKPERPAPKFYKLDFVLKEVDGKRVVNSRNYSILAATDENGQLRAREQVMVPIPNSTQYQTVDAGTDIDTRRITPIESNLALIVTANVSSLPQEANPGLPATTSRHYIWSSDVVIPLRKPTTIFSSDVTTGKTQMQLELTATPVP